MRKTHIFWVTFLYFSSGIESYWFRAYKTGSEDVICFVDTLSEEKHFKINYEFQVEKKHESSSARKLKPTLFVTIYRADEKVNKTNFSQLSFRIIRSSFKAKSQVEGFCTKTKIHLQSEFASHQMLITQSMLILITE